MSEAVNGTSAAGAVRYVRRAPRTGPPAPVAREVAVAEPPGLANMQVGLTSIIQVALPVIGGVSSLIFVLVNPKPVYIATGVLFFFSAIAAGVLMAIQQRASHRAQVRSTRGQYLEYLGDLRRQALEAAAEQRTDALWRHPAPEALLAVTCAGRRTWERRATDGDFLALRAGLGRQPLASALAARASGPSLGARDPVCADALERLERAFGGVPDLPLVAPLARAGVTTVVGPRPAALDLARALVAQLATWHTPNDVRLALCIGAAARTDWDWCKWLPHLHIWDATAMALPAPPAVCSDAADLAAALSALPRGDKGDGAARASAWVVAVYDAGDPGPGRDQLLRQALGRRTSLVVLVTEGEPEPSEVDLRLRVDASGDLTVEAPGAGAPVRGRADRLGRRAAEGLARTMAPLRLGRDDDGQRLLDTIELDRLLGVDDPMALDLARLWRPRPLRERLRGAVGGDPKGADVILDLKESALGGDGPHGLVIGATGSGKSELLRTIVTGLALTHGPDFLSFVLVDFKGGAAFAGLSELPHVSGLITNLADDPTLIDRMRDALFGEIRRRQELLKRAGNLGSLHQYHRQSAAGADLEPLPYLLVVIDEFAELLTAKPDFIELFVAMGRLGRSLGVHLMLASQQLDEGRLRGLEGHLSYRFALRTFSASESRTVIGTPDAYELPPVPGSGYLKVGTTVYTRFRAATVSSPYVPDEELGWRHSDLAPFGLAQLEAEAPANGQAAQPAEAVESAPSGPTFLDVVVGQMRDAAPKVHQVWLPPLTPRLTLDAVMPRGGDGPDAWRRDREAELVVPLGLVDRPAEQRKDVLPLDFRGTSGHLIVAGSSQTGKSTLLRTLICSFAVTHTPLEAQFSCVDFGAGGLSALAGLPHVSGVCGRNDDERLERTIGEVASLLDERERRFTELGIDSPQALRARRAAGEGADGSMADVFLVVDNWPAVRQQNEDLDGPIHDIANRGLGYGIHLVLSINRWMDVRAALREAVGGRLELRLNDPTESAIDRRAASNIAAATPGRGITPDRLHFHVALPRTDGRADVLDLPQAVERLVTGVREAWTGPAAPPVRVLPRRICVEELPPTGDSAAVPIGISGRGMAPVCIDLGAGDPHLVVLGDGESGKTTLLRTMVLGLVSRLPSSQARFFVVDYRRTMLGLVPESHLLSYAAAEPSAASAAAEIAQVLERRLPRPDLTAEELRTRSWWTGPEAYVVVDDYDLVGASGLHPLAPLSAYLAHARDVGLHVLVARRVAGASRALYDPFLGRIRELGSAGVVLAGDPHEGALLGSARASAMPPGRGLLVRRRDRPELIQVAVSDC